MEMPRSCSSRRRSVFLPVRSLMSAVLPWSMCPAVPRVRGTAGSLAGSIVSGAPGTGRPSDERRQHGAGQLVQLGVAHGAQVEEQAAVVQAAHDGRLLFDLRAVRDAELDELAGAVLAALV